jgi:hypothetical protein
MKIVTGKIVAGQVVVEEMPFDEGATVTVFARDEGEFELTLDQEAELSLALEEADRGETIPASEFLKSLRTQA